jgi:type 1 glutamine amidotransferase
MRQGTIVLAVFGVALGAACAAGRANEGAPDADASGPATPRADAGAHVGAAPDVASRAEASSSDEREAPAKSGSDGAGDAPAAPPDAEPASDAQPGDVLDGATSDAPVSGLPARVLLYHFSTLDIPSVPAQLAFFKARLESWGYAVEDSVDPGKLTDDNLARYAAVAMINTCFAPFGVGKDGAAEGAALQKFVTRGGGLFGTHCAAVTFQGVTPVPIYNQLIGGREGNGFFDGVSSCRKLGDHATVSALPATFAFSGNLDNNEVLAPSSAIQVRCKWSTGEMRDVAVSWVRTEGSGRVFYTNFGKVDTDLKDPTLGEKHIVPGLAWVLGR